MATCYSSLQPFANLAQASSEILCWTGCNCTGTVSFLLTALAHHLQIGNVQVASFILVPFFRHLPGYCDLVVQMIVQFNGAALEAPRFAIFPGDEVLILFLFILCQTAGHRHCLSSDLSTAVLLGVLIVASLCPRDGAGQH